MMIVTVMMKMMVTVMKMMTVMMVMMMVTVMMVSMAMTMMMVTVLLLMMMKKMTKLTLTMVKCCRGRTRCIGGKAWGLTELSLIIGPLSRSPLTASSWRTTCVLEARLSTTRGPKTKRGS